jgi:hypothetical protein
LLDKDDLGDLDSYYGNQIWMREIPSLEVLCLRAVGSHACSAEDTFAPASPTTISTASGLLRSFHRRPVILNNSHEPASVRNVASVDEIPMYRSPCIGQGSARRWYAAAVDVHHPFTAVRVKSSKHKNLPLLVQRKGNPATDALQAYIDSLVEMGRMDDTRLGRHFFGEYKENILLGAADGSSNSSGASLLGSTAHKQSKRRRTSATETVTASLSLHNCTMAGDTVEAMVAAGICPHLAFLDLTGIHGLTDDLVALLLQQSPNLQGLSIKNGRRLTAATLQALTPSHSNLNSLDVGGCFNITVADLLKVVPHMTALKQLHASGVGWTDDALERLVQIRSDWTALSFGFSVDLTAARVRQHLHTCCDTLKSLALPFCEFLVDNALLGMLGRNLPELEILDLRGNPGLTTLTGWYDGRASADLPVQSLTVLGRYSGLSESSVEDTQRIHPIETVELNVVLDGDGGGLAIGYEE